MKKITLLLLTFFITIAGYSQLGAPGVVEGFESTSGPDPSPSTNWTLGTGNWYVFNNPTTANVRWGITSLVTTPPQVNSGTNAAYCNRSTTFPNGTIENYLVTPSFTVPSNGQLHFWTRNFTSLVEGTIFQIKVAPATANPLDPGAYALVQQWTDADLVTTFNVYQEKTVNLPSFTFGQPVHIAFVMQQAPLSFPFGDRWLIDDVSIVEQCFDPTNLTANNITLTSAELSWGNPSGSTSWEIEIIPAADSPTGTGIIYNGTLPYLATATQPAGVPFTPTTSYKYYVRAICSSSNSQWIGPFDFATTSPGLSCNAPIQVTTLPYSTTDNTANYSDNPTIEGSPGTSCGITGNYLNGNDVVYSYTAPANGTINVTMTPTAANSGIFAYSSCANVGVTCLNGAAGTTTTVRTFDLPVTAGQTYYFVISSLNTTQTIGYTLIIQTVNCAPPANLGVSGITQTSANLNWAAGGSTSWEIIVQPAGTGIPSGAGITTTNNTAYPTPNPLTANTNYEFYVRADCNDGNFSAWSGPFVFRTLCDAFTVPFQEGFNSTSTTEACWTVLNVNNDPDLWNMNYATNPFEGDQSAMLLTDFNAGANDDWLISPQIILTGNQRLKFQYRVQSATEPNDFRVMLSTNGSSPADFTTTLIPLNSYSNTTYMQAIVNIAAYTGPVNIAWHVPAGGLDGWRLYIDNVVIEDLPTCPEPSLLSNSSVLSTSATINWTNGGTETEWQVLSQPCGTPAPTAGATGFVTTTTGSPYNLTGLSPTTCYDVYVRAVCPGNDLSPWTGPTSFTTQVAPPVCGGQYVDAGGTTAAYPANSNSTVTICPPAGELVTVTFTEFNTETNWDALYVFDGNSTSSPQIASTNGAANVPGGLAGGYWGTTIPGPFVSSVPGGCLTFNFRSDGSIQNAGWVANVTCAPAPTCTKPIQVTATAITSDAAQISWNQLPNPDTSIATQWEVLVLSCADPEPTASTTGGVLTTVNPYLLNGLTPNTCYKVYVRAICSLTDSSVWSSPFTFTTQCVPFTIPFQEGFNTGSASEACWTVLNLNGDTDSWNMNYAVNPFEGDQSAAITTDFNNGNNNDWLISPQITGLNGNQRLKYRYRVQSANEPNDFRVMLSTTGSDPASFTSELVALTSYNNITYIENVVNLTGVVGTINIGFHVPAGGLDGWRLYIDNVIIEDIPECPEPDLLTSAEITSTSALLGWTDLNPNITQWEVFIVPFGSPAPLSSDSGTLVSINPSLITGLTPGTRYTFYVRSVCPSGGFSAWSNGANFTTLVINDNCSGAIFAPVNQSQLCQQVTPGTIAGATASIPAPTAPCVGTADDDVWFQFVASNPFLTVSLQNIVGSTTNLNFAVYSGDCDTLTQIFCSTANTTSGVVNGLTIGQTYFIRVYSNASTAQTTTFNLCISTPASCITGSAACQNLSYQNTTGIANQGTIGCLNTSPNPTYYTINVTTTGPINLLLTQSTTQGGAPNLDVDYAAWGPYTDQEAACLAIGNPPTLAPGIGVPVTQTTGCSYSAAATETLNIANAQAGQVYVILITNFSNQPGYVSLTQTNFGSAGAGVYECCPDAFFTYNPVSYCQTTGAVNPVATISTGSVAGTFSLSPASPAGLVFANTTTGEIDLANSLPGNYLVLNTVAATASCVEKVRGYNISIVAPVSATISYNNLSLCNDVTTPQPVTLTGTTGGTFSVLPNGGLYIDTATGTYTPSLSAPGIYTITYSLPGSGVCSSANPTAQIEILPLPNIPHPAPVITCNSYVLPSLSVGNYYSQAGGLGTPLDVAVPLTSSQIVYIYAIGADGCINETSFTVTINSVPTPTFTTTQSSCASATGTVTVTSPVSQTGSNPSQLFISEVTDSQAGSLTYIELYNGTGASVNLNNYRIKIYNNGSSTSSCDLLLSGTLANNATNVIAVGSNVNQGGVVPNQVFAACGGVNIDDNIRLTTSANVEIDIWGRTDGAVFTPSGQPGYTYRRLASAPHPSMTWNPLDWTAIDPEDYTNVGNYALALSNYEYSLDNGTFQTSTTFSNLAPGTHVLVVKDLITNCTSAPISIEIDAVGSTPSVTDFTYASPFCQNDTNPLPDTSATGFTSGGVYAESNTTTGLVINPATGEIDLANSTTGSHIVTYTVQFNPTTCQQFSTSSFEVIINPVINSIVDFSYTSPVCQDGTNPTPITVTGFTTGGVYSYSGTGLDLNATTGEINLATSTPGTYQVIYTGPTGTCQAEVVSTPVEIVINAVTTTVVGFTYTTPVCQSSTATLSPTLDVNFTTGGVFSSQTGLVINSSTGEIDVTNSTAGTYTVNYDVAANPSICQLADASSFEVVITNSITPEVDFTYTTPVCPLNTTSVLPSLASGFTTGGTFTSQTGLDIDPSTGEIDVTNSTPGQYTITYEVLADVSQCLLAGISSPVAFEIKPVISPLTTFDYPASVCKNDTTNPIPTLSSGFTSGGVFASTSGLAINASTGEIDLTNSSPNTYTITYTVLEDLSICQAYSQSQDVITINPVITPTFNPITICSGDALTLPSASLEGVTGTWSPAINNTATTTYTFTPNNSSQCGLSATLTVVVNQPVVATFASFPAICSGETAPSLPVTSQEGFSGTWSPSTISNTASGTYTFTPTAGQCASVGTLNFVVNPLVSSTFTDVVICQGETISFPATSNENNTGTWSPSVISTSQSGSYTFTPNSGQCVVNGVWNVTVLPTFDFEITGNCIGSFYTLEVNALNSSVDLSTSNFSWTYNSVMVGTNSNTFNVTEYVNGTTQVEEVPITFSVTVTNDDGCMVTKSFTVENYLCTIQKGISANGDGLNDSFELSGYDVKKLTIYNRYGMKVYSKNQYTNQWVGQTDSGDELPDGTYYYVIEFNSGDEAKTGWIYINRAQ